MLSFILSLLIIISVIIIIVGYTDVELRWLFVGNISRYCCWYIYHYCKAYRLEAIIVNNIIIVIITIFISFTIQSLFVLSSFIWRIFHLIQYYHDNTISNSPLPTPSLTIMYIYIIIFVFITIIIIINTPPLQSISLQSWLYLSPMIHLPIMTGNSRPQRNRYRHSHYLHFRSNIINKQIQAKQLQLSIK